MRISDWSSDVCSSDLASAIAADRSTAAARVTLASRQLARERTLLNQGVSPRADYETAEANLAVAQAEARQASAAEHLAKARQMIRRFIMIEVRRLLRARTGPPGRKSVVGGKKVSVRVELGGG